MKLPRHLSVVLSMPPGHWTSETASGKPAVACPTCGGVSDLDEHAVFKTGQVTPIWQCPYACDAAGFLTLEDWAEEVLR